MNSNFETYRTEEETSEPSSDEKMDTGSDTFHSGTPNSDSDELENIRNPQVLRLTAPGPDTNSTQSSDSDDIENIHQSPGDHSLLEPNTLHSKLYTKKDSRNPEDLYPQVLRLSETTKLSHNDSLVTKMSSLNIDTPETPESKNDALNKIDKPFGISPPKFSSTLTLTTSHPLMGLGSPDYPDLIPKKVHKEDEKDLSLSSIEDDRNYSNGFYSPQQNTSKNNLYFTENFITAESIISDSLELPPDVARVKAERRKIVPKLDNNETPPQRIIGRNFEGSKLDCSMKKSSHSTPKVCLDGSQEEFHSVADWSDSPSQLRALPNFELPIEMSSSIGLHNDLDSPDVISSSTQEEKSAYQALLDPYTGSVALRHTPRSPKVPVSPAVTRRKIQLPVEDDHFSLDSLSDATLESEDEPIDLDDGPRTCDPCEQISDDDESKRSKSTNTMSYSDTIPEYSAAEELSNERAYLSVRNGERRICDMKVIEPYKRVVSHGGYSRGLALVVFSACHLPDHSRQDYTYVMDNLFLYVIWTLERLVTEEYILIYLHGSAGRRRLPTFHWLHECYKLIDRRLRKSLKHLYLVHPTFWLKSFVMLTKPFISSKFFKKMSYIKSLDELMEKVPVEPNAIPELVKQFDAERKR